jgi:hypothetical protein
MLRELFDCIYPIHQDLIIQEYMPGEDSQLYWGSLPERPGQAAGGMDGEKAATISARLWDSNAGRKPAGPWIAQAAVSILQAMGHRGYGVVEFKRIGGMAASRSPNPPVAAPGSA